MKLRLRTTTPELAVLYQETVLVMSDPEENEHGILKNEFLAVLEYLDDLGCWVPVEVVDN